MTPFEEPRQGREALSRTPTAQRTQQDPGSAHAGLYTVHTPTGNALGAISFPAFRSAQHPHTEADDRGLNSPGYG
jgi:hypothetical protein